MMKLYTETYEIVIIEQPSERITDSISRTYKSKAEAVEFIELAPPLIESCKYAIKKTVISYLT